MNWLYSHIRSRIDPGRIPYDDACKLFLWLFCSKDILPAELRELVLDRELLVDTFTQLEHDGFIQYLNASNSRASASCRTEWNDLIERLLSGRISTNQRFLERVHTYV